MNPEPNLYAALRAAAAAPRLLVASDFDGVLAPFVADPMEARALEGTLESLAALGALERTEVAVVSGRDLETLTQLTPVTAAGGATGPSDSRPAEPFTRIGSHGAQSSRTPGAAGIGEQERALLDALGTDLEEVLTRHPQARLEHKPAARVLHTRGLDSGPAEAAAEAAREVAARHTGVTVMVGKQVVEMSVVQADKGSALTELAEQVGATAIVYFGDDVTDEHVFELLGPDDVGVKVGDGETAAGWRVDGPPDVALALAELLSLRRATTTD